MIGEGQGLGVRGGGYSAGSRSGGRCNSGGGCVESLLHHISKAVESRIERVGNDDGVQVAGFAPRRSFGAGRACTTCRPSIVLPFSKLGVTRIAVGVSKLGVARIAVGVAGECGAYRYIMSLS